MLLLLTLSWLASQPVAQAQGGGAGTSASAQVRVTRGTLIVTGIDSEGGELVLLEMLVLLNSEQSAYQPSRWEDSSVRLRLPAGASGVTLESGPPDAQLLAAPGGVVLGSALPPGEHPLVLSYRLPYVASAGDDGVLTLSTALALPIVRFQTLVPELPGLEVRPREPLAALGEPVQVGGQQFRVSAAEDLAAGAELSVELKGLPHPIPLLPSAFPDTAVVERATVAMAAVLLLMGVVYGALGGRRRPRVAPTRATIQQLLVALRALEQTTAQSTYLSWEEDRLRLKAQLLCALEAQRRQHAAQAGAQRLVDEQDRETTLRKGPQPETSPPSAPGSGAGHSTPLGSGEARIRRGRP